MKKFKIVKIKKEELFEVVCDFCGKKFDKDFIYYTAFGQIKITFGYSSDYDFGTYSAEICDSCFKTLFKDKMRRCEWK